MRNVRKISKKYYVRQIVACLLVYFMLLGMPVQIALAGIGDGGYTKISGDPTINAPGGTADAGITLNDLQTIINWNNFDTIDTQTVQFLQSIGGNPAVLNRVIGGGMTQFDGSLLASGIDVFIVNTRGLVFGPDSFVQARNFVASGIDIQNSNFLAGIYQFEKFPATAEHPYSNQIGNVTNEGIGTGDGINAENIALIGQNVTNKGLVSAPGGAVVMAAGESVYLSEVGSNVSVEVSQGTTYPDDRVVDNGGSWGTGDGTITANGGKVILAAGDIYSTAIEGIESLRAEATGYITLNGAIDASGHVEILGGQNRIISRNADIYINDDITAGSMRIKNGKDTEPGEESLSGIYVADGKSLTATDGDVIVEAVHDVVLGGDVLASSDVFINGDEDGYGNPKGDNYNPRSYGGGDVIANNITAGGNVDIKGNAIQLNGDVIAAGGDLTITGRTSKDNYTDFSENGLDTEWGYIDVAEETVLYANHDVILKDASGSGGDAPPAGEMDLTGHGWLGIVAEGGSIQTEGPFGEGVKITVEDFSPAFLGMVQADPLNLADYSFGNQNNTDLYLESLNGSVTAVDSSQPLSGKNENAADQWASITATAYTDITLQGHDAVRDIKVVELHSFADDPYTGNISVTSDNRKVQMVGDAFNPFVNGDVIADNGSITLSAINPTNGGIETVGDILASDGITLFGEVTANGEGDQTFDAGIGTLWAKETLSTITKTGPGKLTLAGDKLVDLDGIDGSSGDSVNVQNGALTIDGPVDAEGNLRATGDIIITGPAQIAGDVLSTGSGILFQDDVDADGVGSQAFDAGSGQLIAENGVDIDKVTAGSLTLAGDAGIELGGNVTGTGMTAADSLVFENNVTANGTGDAEDQRLDAGLGALDTDGSIAKTTAGKLNLGGDEGIELGGNVETYDGDLTFEDAVTANGGDQVFDADGAGKDLIAADDVIKTTAGSLTLGAGTQPDAQIELAGDVKTSDGDLILWDKVIANGGGNQVFDADGEGTDLKADDDIIKTTDGSLTLGAGTQPDAQIELAGDVTTTDGDLIFWDKVIASGSGNQVFDADGAGADLIADDDIIKTTAGNLTLGAGTQPDAQIELAGDVTTIDGDITLWDQVIANGSGNQRFDAVGGKLWAQETITKTSSGDLNLGGDDAIDLDGTVDVDAGSLTIEDDFTTVADLIASENVTLEGTATLDGSVNQKIEAENGSLYAKVSVHKTGAGDLNLNAGDNVTIGRPFTGEGNVTANGNMNIIAGTDSVDNVKVLGKLTTTNGGNIDVQAGGDIRLYGTFNGPDFESAQADGDLTLHAGDDIDVLGDLTSNNGSIELSSDIGTTYLGGDATAAIDVTLNNNTEFDHDDDQKVDAQTGTITAKGWLWKNSEWGSLYLEAAGDISLADAVVADWGGVSIISENGKIFTPGGNDDTLNIYIEGYSDQLEGDGVSLPYDPEKKAAIVIISKEDLKLGPDSQLVADGYYLPLHAIDLDGIDSFEELNNYWDELYNQFGYVIEDIYDGFQDYLYGLEVEPEDFTAYKELLGDYLNSLDDRPAIGFLADPATSIGGIIRNEGDPIDVAVYLQSETGDVDVESQLISVNYDGTMVVDAYDTVRFGDLTSEPAIQIPDSIEVPEGRFWEIDRLEVVSRITEWLYQASDNGTLPYPYNPEIVEAFIGGDYVLRGAGLGNIGITDGRAWVLEDPTPPAPLYTEAGETTEKEEFAEGGCPAMMNWLAGEIGVPADEIQVAVAGAFALSTDVQPCDMCARLMNAANTLQDTEGKRLAALSQVINEFVTTPAPPSEEQMNSIAAAFAEHVDDGTQYAVAGEWIDALVAYVTIMRTEMGYSLEDATSFAEKYLAGVNESGNAALAAFVQARIAAIGG